MFCFVFFCLGLGLKEHILWDAMFSCEDRRTETVSPSTTKSNKWLVSTWVRVSRCWRSATEWQCTSLWCILVISLDLTSILTHIMILNTVLVYWRASAWCIHYSLVIEVKDAVLRAKNEELGEVPTDSLQQVGSSMHHGWYLMLFGGRTSGVAGVDPTFV